MLNSLLALFLFLSFYYLATTKSKWCSLFTCLRAFVLACCSAPLEFSYSTVHSFIQAPTNQPLPSPTAFTRSRAICITPQDERLKCAVNLSKLKIINIDNVVRWVACAYEQVWVAARVNERKQRRTCARKQWKLSKYYTKCELLHWKTYSYTQSIFYIINMSMIIIESIEAVTTRERWKRTNNEARWKWYGNIS